MGIYSSKDTSTSSSSVPSLTTTSTTPVPNTIHKGVTYNEKKEVIDCLFCRITAGKEPNGAPLWYKDQKVAVFIPRTPAARLHFLIVPLKHLQNSSTLQSNDIPLLDHMTRVAKQMLYIHGNHLNDIGVLQRCAPPPLTYPYPMNNLMDIESKDTYVQTPSSTTAVSTTASISATSSLSSSSSSSSYFIDTVSFSPFWRLDYHLSPYNSIDHLHLHALYLPYRSLWDSITFWDYGAWTGTPDYVRQLVLPRNGSNGSSGTHESSSSYEDHDRSPFPVNPHQNSTVDITKHPMIPPPPFRESVVNITEPKL